MQSSIQTNYAILHLQILKIQNEMANLNNISGVSNDLPSIVISNV